MEQMFATMRNGIGPSWLEALEPEFNKTYFIKLLQSEESERRNGPVYPPPEDVFTFMRACDIGDVQAIIVGQNPYHKLGQAHGLAFSVRKGVPVPRSLKNIYTALSQDIAGFQEPGHGCLLGWAEQGVLLLNTILTIPGGSSVIDAQKHKGWMTFTDAIISWFNNNCTGIVFMLWGNHAQKKRGLIDKTRHHILEGVHPAARSADFLRCRHFSVCNDLLVADGKIPIDWNRLPEF